MFETILTILLECVCDNYCNCQLCKGDDMPCYLEEEIKQKLRGDFEKYIND